jgi:hypothetical protein
MAVSRMTRGGLRSSSLAAAMIFGNWVMRATLLRMFVALGSVDCDSSR